MKKKIILTIREETNSSYFGTETNETAFRFYDKTEMKRYIEEDIAKTIKCFDLTETEIHTRTIQKDKKIYLVIRNTDTDLTKIYTWSEL